MDPSASLLPASAATLPPWGLSAPSPALWLGLGALLLVGLTWLAWRKRRRGRAGAPRDSLRLALQEANDARSRAEEALSVRTLELAEARDAARSAGRAKAEFLANMSHEIRTPLNAVIGLSENLLASGLDDAQREQVRMVLDAGDQLLRLLDDILDFSTIEAGRVKIEGVEFNLEDAIGDTLRSFVSRASRKGLELACEIAADVPRQLVGDAGRLRQIVTHLVSNAISHTETGEVIVRVQREPIDRALFLRFSVMDTGVGIAPEEIQRLFESFQQADMSTTRAHGGAGLGLSICRGLVQLLGGHMNAVSAVGEGSTFFFTARFEVGSAEEPTLREPVRLEGARVLIVDDNATNRTILADVLRRRRMRPAEAGSAEEALARLEAALEDGRPFHLVLTDLHMPEVDGYGLVERIRAREAFDAARVVMLTSGGPSPDLGRCAALRVETRLMKPVKEYELLGVIGRVLGHSAVDPAVPMRREAPRTLPARAGDRALRVLVVEDSVANQKVALAVLKTRGHAVTIARDGQEAVAVVGSQSFDAVLMDIQMPLMDGFECTEAIRAMEAEAGAARVPIIAMTAHALQGDRERCLEAGMDAYLTKPIRREELFQTLDALVPSAPLRLDWATPLEQVGGDRALLREIVESHVHEIRDDLATLVASVDGRDWPSLRRCAGTLRELLDTFGAGQGAELAQRLLRAAEREEEDEAGAFVHALAGAAKPVLDEMIAFLEAD